MPPRRYKEESKELKKAKAKYEKHFGFGPPCIYQFHDNEQEMIEAIQKSIITNVPLEYDEVQY